MKKSALLLLAIFVFITSLPGQPAGIRQEKKIYKQVQGYDLAGREAGCAEAEHEEENPRMLAVQSHRRDDGDEGQEGEPQKKIDRGGRSQSPV